MSWHGFLYSFPDGKNKLKNNSSYKFDIKPYKKEKKMEKKDDKNS